MSTPARRAGHLFLSGYMGVGKSTVGRLLAARAERPFVDLDEWIVRHAGCDIPTIFAQEGEPGFRRRERDAIRRLETHDPAVVALGGGAVVDPANRRRLRALGTLITLQASESTLRARLGSGEGRPLAAGDPLARLAERAEAYADADAVISTDARAPEAVAADLHQRWCA